MKPYSNPMLAKLCKFIHQACDGLTAILTADFYFGKHIAALPEGSIVFFPYRQNVLGCGIAAIVSYKEKKSKKTPDTPPLLDEMVVQIRDRGYTGDTETDTSGFEDQYLGGNALIESLWQTVQSIKGEERFFYPLYGF